ncbi:darcynin family protein [Cognatishimia activa]|uniref:darcynin family protein n=1 Tax=Cognatishimia activa TaxID=1715691 RepID=UPI00222FB174|nr:darcynin family protein [Cognatishimia activa]UZD92412.1 hypothetical protein M0D42_07340 [Cognatishimia activa]
MTWTIFVLLKVSTEWLSLSDDMRGEIADTSLREALVDDRVTMRFYDAEAFAGRCSDIAVFEASDLQAYYFVMERLRSSALIAKAYFEVIDIFPALENGHQAFQKAKARGAVV